MSPRLLNEHLCSKPVSVSPRSCAIVLCWTSHKTERTVHARKWLRCEANQRRYDWMSTSSLGISTAAAGAAGGSGAPEPALPTSTRKLLPRFLNLHAKLIQMIVVALNLCPDPDPTALLNPNGRI